MSIHETELTYQMLRGILALESPFCNAHQQTSIYLYRVITNQHISCHNFRVVFPEQNWSELIRNICHAISVESMK